ncbi:MAG: HAMP domain-containing histidine kinase [Candidatus Synoicihabitans palmerolidicus]|nr:HAMP domain-containing histidine kinase [Candidatus Synoicihabitans palmerolidicus]
MVAAELFDDATRIHLTSIKRHGVQIETDFASDLRFVADCHNTLQILVNLVINALHAVKSCPPLQRRIELRTLRHENWVRFEVRDHGVGITADNMTRVFQHGFTTREGGHGFGLHSGALAAKRMGGSIVASSEGTGQGTTFKLELPCHSTTTLPFKTKPPIPHSPSTQRPHE